MYLFHTRLSREPVVSLEAPQLPGWPCGRSPSPGPPASPCRCQGSPGHESPRRGRQARGRFLPIPAAMLCRKSPHHGSGHAGGFLQPAKECAKGMVQLGAGEQHTLSKRVVVSLASSLGLEPGRRADIGSSILKLCHLGEGK